MDEKDLIITPFYLILIYLFAFWYKSRIKDKNIQNYFIIALTFKILGALALIVIYRYYYQYGDTLSYFSGCRILTNNILSSPGIVIKTLLSMPSSFDQEILDFIGISSGSVAFRADSNFMVVKFGTVFNIFGLNSIAVTNIFFAFFSTFGIWKMYLTFYQKYPHLHFKLFLAILVTPSLVFWGSGLLKDTISLCLLGFIIYYLYNILYKKIKLIDILYVLVSAYIILIVKSYIVFSLIPPIFFLMYLRINKVINNKFIKLIMGPILFSFSTAIFYLVITNISAYDEKYAVENIIKTAEGTQADIAHNSSEGAAYSLGEIEYTPVGMLRVFPLAVNVTLFRPYLFEARNPVMLLSALENTVILFLFISCLYSYRNSKKILLKDDFLIFGLIFVIFFAFAVGFSTYNFGTLVRYKIPCIPFFIAILVIVKYNKSPNKFSS